MDDRTWSVTELAGQVSRLVGAAFPVEIWVRGQIRSLQRATSGHVFFDLAEPTPDGRAPAALLPVTLFADEKPQVNATLKQVGAVRMDDGIEVRVRGRVQVYARQGRFQLRMTAIDPTYTLGRLSEDRERLLAMLRAEDLVERNRRRPLPLVPLHVGVVTSVGSAAWHDVVHQLEASGLGFRVAAADARTQGPATVASVVAGIDAAVAAGVDVVVVARGGGKRTDLAPFDGAAIARAVATAPVPVLTGIGHEVDTSVADLVAHTACKTPTACAVVLIERVRQYLATIDARWEAVRQRAAHDLDGADDRLRTAALRAGRSTRAAVATHVRRLDDAADRLGREAGRGLDRATDRLDGAAAQVRAHDPAMILARGWSITRGASGSSVRSVADLAPGDRLVTVLADGTVTSTVDATTGAADG